MNREAARKNAETMMAYADGKAIQYRALKDAHVWIDIDDTSYRIGPGFFWDSYEYRIKPHPKKIKLAYIPGIEDADVVRADNAYLYSSNEWKFLEVEIPES